MNISAEVTISVIANVVAIAYFAGTHHEAQKNLNEKIAELKEHFKEKFEALEKKQDKHNNLIERMVKVEASTKSAHKRIDQISSEDYEERG